jgi:hypothetical protein
MKSRLSLPLLVVSCAAAVAQGSHANHTFGTRNYLVQTIWDRLGSFCALSH